MSSISPYKRTAVAHGRPSARISPHKQADPWGAGERRCRTNLSFMYGQNSLPCRINHGSISNKIEWEVDLEDAAAFNYRLLVTFAEGLREVEHPYTFLARAGFADLLRTSRGADEAVRLLPELIGPLRSALSDRGGDSRDIFLAALDAIRALSDAVGAELNGYLSALVVQVAKKLFDPDRAVADAVQATLVHLDERGGPDARACIASKVPTYAT